MWHHEKRNGITLIDFILIEKILYQNEINIICLFLFNEINKNNFCTTVLNYEFLNNMNSSLQYLWLQILENFSLGIIAVSRLKLNEHGRWRHRHRWRRSISNNWWLSLRYKDFVLPIVHLHYIIVVQPYTADRLCVRWDIRASSCAKQCDNLPLVWKDLPIDFRHSPIIAQVNAGRLLSCSEIKRLLSNIRPLNHRIKKQMWS